MGVGLLRKFTEGRHDHQHNDQPVVTNGGQRVIVLTAYQVEALSSILSASSNLDVSLEGLQRQLSANSEEGDGPGDALAASVFAAAQGVVEGAQIEMAAERQARGVAAAVLGTEKLVAAAALLIAQAASQAREANADAAAYAAHEVAQTAELAAADVRTTAAEIADRLASAAARAAETVSATLGSGGDAGAALVALQLAAKVDSAALDSANQTVLAEARVAIAVAAAAARTALAAAEAAVIFEREVAEAASAIRILATATADDLAAESDTQAVQLPLAPRTHSKRD